MVTPLFQALSEATLYGVGALELLLVRHGQQAPIAERRTPEEMSDPPLSAIGEQQIEAVAAHLAGETIDAVYASNLVRAHRTGLAIAARHDLDVTVLADLREVDLRLNLAPGTTLSAATEEPGFADAASQFATTGRWSALPMSERGDEFRARVRRTVEDILDRHSEGRVVIACHGGVVNAYVAEILGIERDYWFRTAHCSVNRVFARGTERRVWRLNETHHLDNGLFTA